jgi:hypothetical protein
VAGGLSFILPWLALVVAFLIYFGVKEMPRRKAEPESENMPEMATFRFSGQKRKRFSRNEPCGLCFYRLCRRFPWNVIIFFFWLSRNRTRL